MKVCLVEACPDRDAGSIGAFYVAHHARMAGFEVDILRETKRGYDVELLSVHHATGFPHLARMPKRARWRLVGGHVMQNNPRPAIPFADAVCIGEGETWIKNALRRLEETDDIDSLSDIPGTVISKHHRVGASIPPANVERPLPDNPPYLNRPGTGSAAWYIEIARGCPYRCHYCELGHSVPYRRYSSEHIRRVIEQTDMNKTRKINLFAPDEASHPEYNDIFDYLSERGFAANFSSMRVESVLRNKLPSSLRTNHLVRIGLDGLTYQTRLRVRKPITDEMLVEYFRVLLERGHIQFKIFMIFGYPWETPGDFDRFDNLMQQVFSLPIRKNVALRIKWTPFIPQPSTPLADAEARYDFRLVRRIREWHNLHHKPNKNPGWYVDCDGLMSYNTWLEQRRLTSGDERLLMETFSKNVLWKVR